MNASKPYVIWLFTDGKPGHENQSQGLLSALSGKIPTQVIRLQPVSFLQIVFSFVSRKNTQLDILPRPDLVVGAGHETHLSLILASWLYNAPSIVLMKPSLPLHLFDLCLIPGHDNVRSGKNVIQTVGVLNRIRPAANKKQNQGVILLGGPSRHYGWDDASLLKQLKTILDATPEIQWLASDSRRTPADTSMNVARLDYKNVKFQSSQTLPPDWLPKVLAESSFVWVTEDSVSMVYEALTARAAVGLLAVPEIKKSRVSRGIAALLEAGFVNRYADWQQGNPLQASDKFENEADRCAEEIIKRWHLEN